MRNQESMGGEVIICEDEGWPFGTDVPIDDLLYSPEFTYLYLAAQLCHSRLITVTVISIFIHTDIMGGKEKSEIGSEIRERQHLAC